jgi:hypothetical protein
MVRNETIAKTTPPSTFGKVLSKAFTGVITFFGGRTDKSELETRIQDIKTVVNNPRAIDASSVEVDMTEENIGDRKSMIGDLYNQPPVQQTSG